MRLFNRQNKKRSIILSWILSYVVILSIPIFVGFFVYAESVSIIENEIHSANEGLLLQTKSTIDKQFVDARQINMQLLLNPRVQNLMYKQTLEHTDRILIFQIVRELVSMKAVNPWIDDIFIYYRGLELVVSPDSNFEADAFFRMNDFDISLDQWNAYVRQEHKQHLFSIPNKSESFNYSLIYGHSLPLEGTGDPLANIFVVIANDILNSAIENIQAVNHGEVVILNKDNEPIIYTSEGIPELLNTMDHPESGYAEWNGERYVVASIKSDVTEWNYMMIISDRSFTSELKRIRQTGIVSLLVTLIIGSIATYMMSKRQYYPIHRLIEKLSIPRKELMGNTRNEYAFLERMYDQTIDEYNRMNHKLEQQQKALLSNFLVRLLKGRVGNDAYREEMLATFDIRLKTDLFAVLILYIDDFNELFYDRERDDAKQLDLVHLIIKNVVEEVMNEQSYATVLEIDDMLACIVNVRKGSDEKELRGAIERAQTFIRKRFRIVFTASISRIHSGINNVSFAYRDAIEAMEYKLLLGSGTIISYDDLKVDNQDYFYTLEKEQKIIQCIKTGDYDYAKSMMDQMFEQSLTAMPIEMAKCFMFDMTGTFLKAMSVLGVENSGMFEQINPMVNLTNCETIMDLQVEMHKTLQYIAEYIEKNKKSNNSKLQENIHAFIKHNYSDENLNISRIADHFEMNPIYISRTYKEKTGEGILDVITHFRLERAKVLLADKELSIKQISEQVGYYNSNAFIRLFKKHEGITPGKYREIILTKR